MGKGVWKVRGNSMNSKDDELWNDYSSRFNLLSDKMVDANIKLEYLTDVIESYENLPGKYKNSGVDYDTIYDTLMSTFILTANTKR